MRMYEHTFGLILHDRIMYFNKLLMYDTDEKTIMAALQDVLRDDFLRLKLDMVQGRLDEHVRRERVRNAYPKGAVVTPEGVSLINEGQPNEQPPHS